MRRALRTVIVAVLIFTLCLTGCSSNKEEGAATGEKASSGASTGSGTISKTESSSEGSDAVRGGIPSNTADAYVTSAAEAEIPAVMEGGAYIEESKSAAILPEAKAEMPTAKEGETYKEKSDSAAAVPEREDSSFDKEAGDVIAETGEVIASDISTAVEDRDFTDDGVSPERDEIMVVEEPIIVQPVPQAGLLTAGEWNDNKNMEFIKDLLANGQDDNYSSYFEQWELTPYSNISVCVNASGSAIKGARAELLDSAGNQLYQAVTDNTGMAYMFYNMNASGESPAAVRVSDYFTSIEYVLLPEDLSGRSTINIDFSSGTSIQKQALDIMFMFDTTGSMSDELVYLQQEMRDVITRVKNENGNIPVNLSVNFYRDLEDEYVVRSYPFTQDINEQIGYLNMEYASGGGDYEEAVELALEDAVYNHSWNYENVKIMFLILDAPPHNTPEVRAKLASAIDAAAAAGIRIIPIASSGVDKSTEFLMRAIAMATGGTYTFLTDDSGIGGSHIEPTIGAYEVEQLNNLIVRLVNQYLK